MEKIKKTEWKDLTKQFDFALFSGFNSDGTICLGVNGTMSELALLLALTIDGMVANNEAGDTDHKKNVIEFSKAVADTLEIIVNEREEDD